ncbi:MAG TPA: TerC family protein [Candidatus Acidoferrales bacterium]|nr:TerC family protein [Candidatus Acidoferrales bacterium]
MLGTPVHLWAVFGIVIAVALVVDLVVLHPRSEKVSLRKALIESAAWIVLSLLFGVYVHFSLGTVPGVEFYTGYLVEKSLSVDNIFVFILIFQAFQVPERSHHKVLFYGVFGALVMRAVFVLAGVELIQRFHFILYFFGAILVFTAIQMLRPGKREIHPERNWLVRITRKFFPVVTDYSGDNFFVKRERKWYATPLFLAVMAVEAMDIVFAVDSVPAVLAITRDTFIVYSSNAFAILGLRALYFALADILPRFRYLHQGLAAILLFVGAKMIASDWIELPDLASLGVIAAILAIMIVASLIFAPKQGENRAH